MDMKLRLRPEEVHTYCKVVPFDMMLGPTHAHMGRIALRASISRSPSTSKTMWASDMK